VTTQKGLHVRALNQRPFFSLLKIFPPMSENCHSLSLFNLTIYELFISSWSLTLKYALQVVTVFVIVETKLSKIPKSCFLKPMWSTNQSEFEYL